MNTITTHVLDTSLGRPAAGVAVALEQLDARGGSKVVGNGLTDADGRVRDLVAADKPLTPGDYRLRFETGEYFARDGREAFYPVVDVCFTIVAEGHYHVPLLLNPFGYSTYRGS